MRGCLPDLVAVISGGQTGVDRAALRVARAVGLSTGGYAPLGYRTLAGDDPSLRDEYGLVESWDRSYRSRTARNVHAADATLRIALDFDSPGGVCTMRAIRRYGKPHLDVFTTVFADVDRVPQIVIFLRDHRVRVLNVAGNSEETYPGVGRIAEALLLRALAEAWSGDVP